MDTLLVYIRLKHSHFLSSTVVPVANYPDDYLEDEGMEAVPVTII